MPRKRELHDPYFKKAKEEGYAARSAYKLKEIQERYRVLQPGMWVLDLGCAPGSWLQVASELVGAKGGGRVAGIDLQPIGIDLPFNAKAVVGDVFHLTPESMKDLLGGPASIVLSDMAPNTTGDPGGDHFRSIALCRRVVDMLPTVLMPGGNLVMKVFEGQEYPTLLRDCEKLFAMCKGNKPDATRDVSREMFIVGIGYSGRAHVDAPPPGVKLAGKRPEPKPGWGGGGKK